MASRPRRATTAEVVIEPVIYGPDNGGNVILAAWQGLYHLFGARVERFDVTSDGVFAINPTVSEDYNLDTILHDLTHRGDKVVNRRMDFLPLHFWATGNVPAPFMSSTHLTIWMTQFLKGTGEKGRSPQYAKDAIRDFKASNGLAVPRGRPRKTFKLTELGALNESALDGIDISELTKFRATLDSVIAQAPVEVTA